MIEISRYNQTTKDNRNCPFGGSNLIEDKVETLIPNITQLSINDLIDEVMNPSNYFINM